MNSAQSTRQNILAAAVDLFLSKGAGAVSMREVAKAAAITPMAIYRHYADKRDLVAAVMQTGFDRYEAYLSIEKDGCDALQHMRRRASRIFDFAVEQSAFFELMFLSSRTTKDMISISDLRTLQAPTYKIAREAIEQCRASGQLNVDDIDACAQTLLAYCIGFCSFQLMNALEMPVEAAKSAYLAGFDRILIPLTRQEDSSI